MDPLVCTPPEYVNFATQTEELMVICGHLLEGHGGFKKSCLIIIIDHQAM